MEHIDALVTMHLPTITEEGNISDIFMYILPMHLLLEGLN